VRVFALDARAAQTVCRSNAAANHNFRRKNKIKSTATLNAATP